MLMTRSMAQRLPPVALQGHTALAACLLIVPLLALFEGSGNALFDPVWPQGHAVWTLLGVGIVATISHLCLTFALRYAPAGTIAPLQYLEIVGATVIGYLAFGAPGSGLPSSSPPGFMCSSASVGLDNRSAVPRRHPRPPFAQTRHRRQTL
jgi:drug/metabolite transporter (DMT)-like permease